MGLVGCMGKGEVTWPFILPTRPQMTGMDDFYVLTALPGRLNIVWGFSSVLVLFWLHWFLVLSFWPWLCHHRAV